MIEHIEAVTAVLRNVDGLQDVKPEQVHLRRLGGLTNLVHLAEVQGQNVVVRIPGEGTEAYINRSVEIHNARAAERAGVSPQVLWASQETGVMVTRAIESVETMTPALFKSRRDSPARAGKALARLHNSGETFSFRFELFNMIEEYLRVLATKDVELPPGYHDVVRAAEPVRVALARHPAPLAPCHCDPLCENFLDDGAKMWIVDWEYSGMNDPLWDLGDLSVEAEMTEAQEHELLLAYFGTEPRPAQWGRVTMYKALCDLLWTLWGLIQHADKNPASDFWAYAMNRFSRCQALMNSPQFASHLKNVGGTAG